MGNPVREDLMHPSRSKALKSLGFSRRVPVVSIIGGSQGSRTLNTVVRDALKDLFSALSVQVVWQTGSGAYGELQSLRSQYPSLRIFPFIQDMGAVYAASDLVVSRAGALALAEITACGKPSILVPFPGAAADHQTTNARILQKAGAAMLLPEKDLSPQVLVGLITQLLSNRDRLKKMGQASRSLSVPGASKRIAQEILSLATS